MESERYKMNNEYTIGKIAGLQLSATPSAIIGLIVLWVILSGLAIALLQLTSIEAIVGGLIAALLHIISELIHQFGHALAARGTGYPMQGVRLWLIFGSSIYPDDEPELPAQMHVRRALGGAPVSAIVTVIIGLIALSASSGLLKWLTVFLFFDNLFVFTLGAFLPLGFTDGSTLLKWWGKR